MRSALIALTNSAFELSHDDLLPEDLVAVAALFALSAPALRKAIKRDEPPDGELTPALAQLLRAVLEARLADYPTSIEEDNQLLLSALPERKRMAVIVRRGEKAILRKAIAELVEQMPVQEEPVAKTLSRKEARAAKRIGEDVDARPSKRPR